MRSLIEFDPGLFQELLGERTPGCTGNPMGGQISPVLHRRVILVGLGGSGIKTLEQVKKWVLEHMTSDWDRYIAFLGVDCDWKEMEQLRYMAPRELLRLFAPGMQQLLSGPAMLWPGAWHHVAEEAAIRQIPPNGTDDSTQCSRLKAKLMFHGHYPGEGAPDQEFLCRLREIQDQLYPVNQPEAYEYYVIAGLAGGFGSGLAPEMAALIRTAFPGARVHGVFYTPDTLAYLAPGNARRMEANGYAALKEIDHIQKMPFQGAHLTIPVSEPAAGFRVEISGWDMAYSSVALMDGQGLPGPNGWESARAKVSNHLLARLHCHNSHFGEEYQERHRHLHGTIPGAWMGLDSVRTTDCPDLIWAGRMAALCEKAGLVPVSNEECAVRMAAGEAVLPFMGKDQLFTEAEASRHIQSLLHPLMAFLNSAMEPAIRFERDIPGIQPTWEDIHSGYAEQHMVTPAVIPIIRKKTSMEAIHEMKDSLRDIFQSFERAVLAFVKEYGPMAIVNLYHGQIQPSVDGAIPRGIGMMIHWAVDGMNPMNGAPVYAPGEAELRHSFMRIDTEIRSENKSPIIRLLNKTHYENQAMEWTGELERLINARIREQRMNALFGRHGILHECFQEPVDRLLAQIYTVGKMLESITALYRRQAEPLGDYLSFSYWASQNPDAVIFAAPEAYDCLMEWLRTTVARVDPRAIRDELLDQIWQELPHWLAVPEQMLAPNYRLRNPESPIPARRLFDTFMRERTGQWDYPLQALLADLAARNIPVNGMMNALVQEMWCRQHRGHWINTGNTPSYRLLYCPLNLPPNASAPLGNSGLGTLVPTRNWGDLTLERMDPGLELWQLHPLESWRQSYRGILCHMGNGLHGYGPRCDGADPRFWENAPDLPESPAGMS